MVPLAWDGSCKACDMSFQVLIGGLLRHSCCCSFSLHDLARMWQATMTNDPLACQQLPNRHSGASWLLVCKVCYHALTEGHGNTSCHALPHARQCADGVQ